MNPDYGTLGGWRVLAGVAGLHLAALASLAELARQTPPQLPRQSFPMTSAPAMLVSLLLESPPAAPLPAQARLLPPARPAPSPPVVAAPALVDSHMEVPARAVEVPRPKVPPLVELPPLASRAEPGPMAQEARPTPVPLPAAPSPSPAPAPVAPLPVVAPRFDVNYLQNPPPAYPTLSRRLGEQGRVLLRVLVEPEGLAAQVEVRESSGFERLDLAAREVVSRWRFVPARQGGKAVSAWVLVPISFSLRS